MVYDHTYFRKSVERCLPDVEKKDRMIIKDYMDSMDKLLKEKEETIKRLKEKKPTSLQIFIEIVIQVSTLAIGGLWSFAFQNNLVNNILLFFMTFLFIIILVLKYTYAGVTL